MQKLLWVATGLAVVATAIIPLNFFVLTSPASSGIPTAFWVLATVQLVVGVAAAVCSVIHAVRRRGGVRVVSILLAVFAGLVGLGGPVGMFLVLFLEGVAKMAVGGAWGRPLRVRGKLLHPRLSVGSDWTRGERPDVRDLDEATRAALEALWLHDAQKEHASVPAFARITWLLCAVGAPGDLVAWSNRAAAEEIDHARRCFALAAGYGGRPHTAEPMPDLLLGGLDLGGDALVRLAVESLEDGCLLEDFNADVAGECARACRDRATRDVLERIAGEERSHAEFSWALLAWLLARGEPKVARAIRRAQRDLERVVRPTAVSGDKLALVARADAAQMRAHGRIDDAEWAALWNARIEATRARTAALLGDDAQRAA
ncbi:MAG TPA: ferritin-like domain-containing protein [Polyangiaceae bacterium]|jgi:hypothetical protein